MPRIQSNEREFQSQVVSWLNKFIEQGGYPFTLASGEVSLKGDGESTRFPDVQLWINREAGEGFCGWELKTPDTAVDDLTLLENASEKASRMQARYFVTWNMRDAVIWEIVEDGKKKHQRLFSYPSLTVNSVEDLKIESQRILLENEARKILDDLSRLCHKGHLTFLGPDDWFFIHRLTDTAHAIQPRYRKRLMELVGGSADFRRGLMAWAATQGFITGDAEEFYNKIAYQIVYQLLGRLLFFEVLRRFQTSISPLDIRSLDEEAANRELNARFAEVRAIDYQAIFEEDFPDKIPVPVDVLPDLGNLIADLNKRDFAHLPQEVLGSVFENLIPPEERHRLGQYFTREDLVDFIIAFCVRSSDSNVLDPTCGTGTFLIRAYDKFKWQFAIRDHQKLLSRIWGVDIAPFPAELATINLYRQEISNIGNFPRILKKDFFLMRGGQEYEFPPNKQFADDPSRKIKEKFPGFDAIVGNPPYIRQEDIDKASTGYSGKVVQPALAADYGALGYHGVAGNYEEAISLSGQADIYASMFVHAAALLKEGGRLGFVTSNSWLGSEYGRELQKFFLRHFKIIAIVESRVEPWFETAQVNTIFTILERCDDERARENNLVKFVSVKKKLADLIPWDTQTDAGNRWHNLDILVRKIESQGDRFVRIKRSGEIVVELPKLVNDFEGEDFRVRVIKQGLLKNEIPAKFGEGHWGRFLRAPGIYFELQEQIKDKLASLSDKTVAELSYGLKPGITEFFNVDANRAKQFGIEPEYLVPFLSSFRDVEEPVIDPGGIPDRLFVCDQDKNELRRLGKKGALKYIEWGEAQKTSGRGAVGRAGVPWPEAPSVKGRELWYDVGERKPGDVIINQFIGERVFFPLNIGKALVSNTFFEIKFFDEKLRDFWTALMNSTLFYLFVYVHGRVDWSQGPLRIYGPEIESLFLPDARKISREDSEKILAAFEPILKRPIRKISEEVKQKDRKAFDATVLAVLGLDPGKYLDAIYGGLVDLVETRVKLGKMQTIQKKLKKTKDIPKIKEEVFREVIPDGLKPFPEAFIVSHAKRREVAVPPGKLRFGNHFFGKQEVINERGEKYEASSEFEAEYIIFARKPDSHIVSIPDSPFDVQNTVVRYKKYLKELREKLMREFVMRTGDEKSSERFTAEVMEDLGVVF